MQDLKTEQRKVISKLFASTQASIIFRFKRTINRTWVPDILDSVAHTGLVCGCWLTSSARWVFFFSSSEPSLWADAIPSASSTCQMPWPALMADVLLDAIPASALAPACITVHFPASPPPPLCSAKPHCQPLSAVKEFCHRTTPPHRHRMFLGVQEQFGNFFFSWRAPKILCWW